MNRLVKRFESLKKNKEKAFIAYLTAGYPDLGRTIKCVRELENIGADVVELGVPFSDPLADGPTIQQASHNALAKGINVDDIFKAVVKIRLTCEIPLVLMTYYNPVYKYGVKKFIIKAGKCGVDGVIVPDLPYEESGEILEHARSIGLSVILLAAPTSDNDRLRNIVKASTGFIYYVSLTGVTGARRSLPVNVKNKVLRIKKMTKKPVCVGFGVSSPDQARKMSSVSDGVIVGSAIVKIIQKNSGRNNIAKALGSFVKPFIKEIKRKRST